MKDIAIKPADPKLLREISDAVYADLKPEIEFKGVTALRLRKLADQLEDERTSGSAKEWKETARAISNLRDEETRMYQRTIAGMAEEIEVLNEVEPVTIVFEFAFGGNGFTPREAQTLARMLREEMA